jgi:hypothetical protein
LETKTFFKLFRVFTKVAAGYYLLPRWYLIQINLNYKTSLIQLV